MNRWSQIGGLAFKNCFNTFYAFRRKSTGLHETRIRAPRTEDTVICQRSKREINHAYEILSTVINIFTAIYKRPCLNKISYLLQLFSFARTLDKVHLYVVDGCRT